MSALWPPSQVTTRFERVILSGLQVFLILLVGLATVELFYLLAKGVVEHARQVDSVQDLQALLERGFAGVLLVMIGLELLATIRAYVEESVFRLEVVLVVGIIALARHVILIDLEHVGGGSLLGIAALLLGLVAGYFVARRGVVAAPLPGSTGTAPMP
ncbi:phosphate-starvation-inducible PsiE family protein [Luteimonas sp. A534]